MIFIAFLAQYLNAHHHSNKNKIVLLQLYTKCVYQNKYIAAYCFIVERQLPNDVRLFFPKACQKERKGICAAFHC